MNRNLIKILGCCVDSFTVEQALDHACELGGQVITINPEMISNAQNNSDFKRLINSAELVIPDGIGVEIGLKILGKNVRRIAGIEFGKSLIKRYYEMGKKIALVGAKPEIISKTVANLKTEFDGIQIVYVQDGYFKDTELIYDQLKNCSPDLVLVALGSPKQEYFIKDLKTKLPNALMIGLGGSFDVWSGVVKRAPEIYQNLGLEWLYRTVKEPQRFKRIFPTLPLFVLAVLKERLLQCFQKKK